MRFTQRLPSVFDLKLIPFTPINSAVHLPGRLAKFWKKSPVMRRRSHVGNLVWGLQRYFFWYTLRLSQKKCSPIVSILCNYFTLFLRALSLHTIHLQVLSLCSVPAENHETPQLSPQENLIHMKTIGLFCNPSTNNGLVAPLHNPAKHPTSTNATV